jgi:hypothetical protein
VTASAAPGPPAPEFCARDLLALVIQLLG